MTERGPWGRRPGKGVAGGGLAALLLAPLLLAGVSHCGPQAMPAATGYVAPPPSNQAVRLFVGVSRGDITPPPGVATFGHGPEARIASGYWTRLQCRAFVFLTETGNPAAALVPCELAAISTLLQRTVVQKLRGFGIEIPPQRLFLSAVHTHAGPAHYLDAEFYDGTASTQGPGFDPQVVEFLASRIAGAVRDAFLQATQDRQAPHPQFTELRWIHGKAWGLTHNRSLSAFQRNRPLGDFGEPSKEAAGALDPSALAVDPNLDVLELSVPGAEGKRRVRGWIGLLAMHPTVLSAKNRYFGGDAFGVASRLMEQELRREGEAAGTPDLRPLVGLINTNEGDVVPRWSTGDRAETLVLGKRLAQEFLKLRNASGSVPFQTQAVLSSSYLEVELPNNTYGLPQGQQLCSRAELGLGSIYGAVDHPTGLAGISDLLPTSYDPQRQDCQAPKRAALGAFQKLISGPYSFPRTVPLGMVRLDDTWVAFLPAEITVTAGQRIRQGLAELVPFTADGRPVQTRIGGLTNGYMEYISTPEEYQLQRYEGASTLYGPTMAPFLAAVFRNMGERLVGRPSSPPPGTRPEVAANFSYATGPKRSRLPTAASAPLVPRSLNLCRIPGPRIMGPPSYCFTFEAGAPGQESLPPRSPVQVVALDPGWQRLPWRMLLDSRSVAPEVADPQLRSAPELLGDDGFEFVTAVHERTTRGWIWTSLFTPTPDEWPFLRSQEQRFAFSVGGLSGPGVLRSEAFSFNQGDRSPPECTLEAAERCGGLE